MRIVAQRSWQFHTQHDLLEACSFVNYILIVSSRYESVEKKRFSVWVRSPDVKYILINLGLPIKNKNNKSNLINCTIFNCKVYNSKTVQEFSLPFKIQKCICVFCTF